MKTLRYTVCPCCDRSMSPKALDQQAFGRFQVDIRACNGRKGFPHVAMDDLNSGERVQVRARLLGTIQAAVAEGVLTSEDLHVLVSSSRTNDRFEIVMPRAVGESVEPRVSEFIRAKAREE